MTTVAQSTGVHATASFAITVPAGVTSAMESLWVFATATATLVGWTMSAAGVTFTQIDDRAAGNMRVGVFKGGAGLSTGAVITVGFTGTTQQTHCSGYYTDEYDILPATVSPAIRSVSSSVCTTGSLTPAAGQALLTVSLERTTATPTTITSAVSSAGETITQLGYDEDNSTATTIYFGELIAASLAAHTTSVTYNSGSANGYAALIAATLPVPVVTGLAPVSGPSTGGTGVTLAGTGFTAATAVAFGAGPAGGYTVVSDTQITATAPAQAAGTVDVRVSTVYGTSAVSGADQFTFTPPLSPGTLIGTVELGSLVTASAVGLGAALTASTVEQGSISVGGPGAG